MKKILIFLLFISATTFSQVVTERSTTIEDINNQSCYIHTVEKGQTVYSISRAYDISVKMLILENDNIASNFKLTIGQKVIIPTASVGTKQINKTKAPFRTPTVNKNSEQYYYHIVKPGEWAYQIARDYNVTFNILKENNPNVNLSKLEKGTELLIPKDVFKKRKIFVSDEGMILHSIKKGETLYSIAKEYNINLDSLMNYNNGGELNVGTIIRIPSEFKQNLIQPKYKNYKNYTVKSKETLYRISRKFQIDLKLLIEINNINDDFIISEGQVLKIPSDYYKDEIKIEEDIQDNNWISNSIDSEKKKADIELKEDFDPFGENSKTLYVKHTVLKGQTPYSISKQYNIPLSLLYEYNPQAKGVISIGENLKIPIGGSEYNNRVKDVYSKHNFTNKDFNFNSKKKIALFLPLYLKDNQLKAKATSSSRLKKQFHSKSLKFYKFYQGALIALEELVRNGKQIDLTVFDTENSSKTTAQIMKDNDISDCDLIIGPIYNKNISVVGDTAKKYLIPIISPLSPQLNKTLSHYENYYKINTPIEKQIEVITSLIAKKDNKKIILITSNKKSEKKIGNLYEKYILKYNKHDVAFNKIKYTTNLSKHIGQSLSKNKNNIIIVASSNESLATQIVNDIIYYTKDYNITLIGTQSWNSFNKNIELGYLFDLNLTLFSFNNINYENKNVKNFITLFKNKYVCEPDNFSFRGYDITKYFLNQLFRYGSDFNKHISEVNKGINSFGLQNNFYFSNTNIAGDSCYINNATKILRYDKQNYKITDIDEIIFQPMN